MKTERLLAYRVEMFFWKKSLNAGMYQYHLKDHLGNTRAMFSKNAGSNQPVALAQATDYYPFGKSFESSNVDKNRYLYNGKELQDQVIGSTFFGWYDYGARFYDPELGRWHSVDPLAEKYYSISSYVYCADNPIRYIDPDGRLLKYAPGTSQEFKVNFVKAAKYLNAHGAGGILKKLMDSKTVVYLKEGNGKSSFSPKNMTITWDPELGVITNKGIVISPTTVFNHEGDHALQQVENPKQKEGDKNTPDAKYGNKEEKRVITGSEQDTAKKLGETKEGEVTRIDHGGTPIETKGPTTTEEKNAIVIKPQKDENSK